MTPTDRSGKASPADGVKRGLAGVLHDVTTLAELQLKLLAVDAKESAGRGVVPVALLGAAAVFALSALPLLLVAFAQLLRDQAGWPAAAATLTAVLAGLVIAGVLGAVGAMRLRRMLEPLERSRDEFNRNVEWLKNTLKRQEAQTSPMPNQPR